MDKHAEINTGVASTERVSGPPPRLLLTLEEAAHLLSIGRPKMWQLVMAGTVLSVKIGASRRVPATALDAYVRRLMASALDMTAHVWSASA